MSLAPSQPPRPFTIVSLTDPVRALAERLLGFSPNGDWFSPIIDGVLGVDTDINKMLKDIDYKVT